MPVKKTAKQEAAEKFVADLESRIEWKNGDLGMDDAAVRHVNRTLETARWIASQRLGYKAGEDPAIVLAVYDKITARTQFLMDVFPHGMTAKAPDSEKIQEQTKPLPL